MFARSFRALVCLGFCGTLLPGCHSPGAKTPPAQKAAQKQALKEKKKEDEKKPKIPDMSADTSFLAFVGRLRIAVAKRDKAMLTSMMTTDFGYRWDPAMQTETAFDYWDEKNLWPEMQKLLNQRFVPNGMYMVSPPQFVSDPSYNGYRLGLALQNGGWRFAYFIGGQDPLP